MMRATHGIRFLPLFVLSSSMLCSPGCDDDGAASRLSIRTLRCDTLACAGAESTVLHTMFARSADDIYLGGYQSAALGSLWHYDGSRWSEIDLLTAQAGHAPFIPAVVDLCGGPGITYAIGFSGGEGVILQGTADKFTRIDDGGLPDIMSCMVRGNDLICSDYSGRLHIRSNGVVRSEETPFLTDTANTANESATIRFIKPVLDHGIGCIVDRTTLVDSQRSMHIRYVAVYDHGLWNVVECSSPNGAYNSVNDVCVHRNDLLAAHNTGVAFVRNTGRETLFPTGKRAYRIASNGTLVAVSTRDELGESEVVIYYRDERYRVFARQGWAVPSIQFAGDTLIIACNADESGIRGATIVTMLRITDGSS